MDTNQRLLHLVSLRVKLRAAVSKCNRKIMLLEKERDKFKKYIDEANKEIISHRKRSRVFWWWPWGD